MGVALLGECCSMLHRLVMEKEANVMYSCVQNTRYPQEEEMVGIEIQDWVSRSSYDEIRLEKRQH